MSTYNVYEYPSKNLFLSGSSVSECKNLLINYCNENYKTASVKAMHMMVEPCPIYDNNCTIIVHWTFSDGSNPIFNFFDIKKE